MFVDALIEVIKAVFLGIVEGITEWLPVSSTGHMILVDEFIRLDVSDEFREMFIVVIQLGAILAVPVLFWDKLFPLSRNKSPEQRRETWSLWLKICVGVLPAAVIGLFLDDILTEYLYRFEVVAIALIAYGIAFIVIERLKNGKEYRIESVHDITYRDALIIGAFQTLSLIPGTSRSGSTILGGMLNGVSRTAASEFSFFMAIPVMAGASLLKVVKFAVSGYSVTTPELMLLLVGILVSFTVSLFAIEFLMGFVKRHSFEAFGIYRIVLGVIVLGYFVFR